MLRSVARLAGQPQAHQATSCRRLGSVDETAAVVQVVCRIPARYDEFVTGALTDALLKR
ncbi:MAG: hypothetical protein K2X97_20585 [Mycobacteriaceae bacterium]|nr:hypothetical protein [Mycobacteriaceae bacterium]